MDMVEKQKMIDELKEFHKQLKTYQRYIESDRQLSEAQERYKNSLMEKLQRKFGTLKDIITQLSGNRRWERFGHVHDIWLEGLSSEISLSYIRPSLKMCIDATNEAIGKLESTPISELEAEEVCTTVEESPLDILDSMRLHPKVVEVSESLFKTGNYASAIFEAFKAVHNYVQEKTGLPLDGVNLMEKVFNENKPILQLNELLIPTDKNEQKGFKYLFMGSQMGIRNPKAHENVKQEDPNRTLEYLSIASLLMKRIDESKLVKLNIKE